VGSSWLTSPRFWLWTSAAGSLALAVAFAVGAIMVGPIRLGFASAAVAFILSAGACGWSAATGREG
jgi:hypothetical protein